jgi:succinyl-diaminopimelate desuccinylase
MHWLTTEAMTDLLSELVGIHSPYFEEDQIIDYVAGWLEEAGIEAQVQNYHEDRVTDFKGKNILGKIAGKPGGPTIYLNGHLDTVTLCEGWTYDPLNATVTGDRLYGLGALDMKAGVASILLALRQFKEDVREFKGNILFSLVSDEEGPYGLGTDAVINSGFCEGADVGIVTEPSSGFSKMPFPNISLGARGGYAYTVTFKGKAAHAANPEEGISAILDAAKVALALKETDLPEDPYLGKGSICIIGMEGGGAACSVADQASFKVFRHVIPGENMTTLREEVDAAVKRAGIRCTYEMAFREAPNEATAGFLPYVVAPEEPYASRFAKVVERTLGERPSISYFSSIGDFNYIGSRLGIPTLIFGADGENYHSSDEYVNLSSASATTKVLYEYMKELLED